MKRYIITGAQGHLGNTIIRMMAGIRSEIYGLILPDDDYPQQKNVKYIRGDVRDLNSMRPLFEAPEGTELYVIHTAGIIDISEKGSPLVSEVNINGTRNIIKLCQEYKAKRLLYVSTVHAIPEPGNREIISEAQKFFPDKVTGIYAQTKAVATQAVLDAGAQGLNVVVVHPSGIIGPYDYSGNHLVQMITDYIRGKFYACVRGGYDFVDVRDVARGCILAMYKGRANNCYILSGRHYEILEILLIVRSFVKQRKPAVLPMWMARAGTPLIQCIARCRHQRPLYTSYSLYTLRSNDHFSHEKATRELGYSSRDMKETIRDTVEWYIKTNKTKSRKA